MTIEQIIDIPADYRVLLELPHSIPSGVKAKVEISIPAAATDFSPPIKIEDVRQLLQKEMIENGTSAVTAKAGEGWEAHVREHYAEP